MSLSYETPDYFLDFHCLGGDCEDTCCQHWEIKLDKHHYRLLEDVMSKETTEKQLFEQYIKINEQPVSGDHDYAFITLAENGYCPMLGNDGLCTIHAKYGVQPLGNVCMFFPRVISRGINRIEMSGTLSCPEVARRCLFSESKVRYVRFSPSNLPRPRNYPIQRELPGNERDHYARYFSLVRKAFINILSNFTYDLNTRLYAVASLAHSLSAFYHKDCSIHDESILHETIDSMMEPENMQKLSIYVSQYESSQPIGLIVIKSILQIKQTNFPEENTSQLAESISRSFLTEFEKENDGMDVLSNPDLQTFYQARQELCNRAFGVELEKYLSRYLENVFYREWFYTMPDTFTYVQMLLVRVAMLRYLIVFNPKILAIARRQLDTAGEKSGATLDLTALQSEVVHVVYNFARAIDQNMPFLQVIYNALGEQQMMNFDYSLAFIKS